MGHEVAFELCARKDPSNGGFRNFRYLPYFAGGNGDRTVFVYPEQEGQPAFTVAEFFAEVQKTSVQLLEEIAAKQAAQDKASHKAAPGAKSTGKSPKPAPKPQAQQEPLSISEPLAANCAKFREAVEKQKQGGVDEPEWMHWGHSLTSTGHVNAALEFSQLSGKHDQRSISRIELFQKEYEAGTATPPVRCTTFGCTEEQIQACFKGKVYHKDDGISNNPLMHVEQEAGGARKEIGKEDGLQVIYTTNRPLRHVSEEALGALKVKNEPPILFRRANELVRIIFNEQGLPCIERLEEAALRGVLTRSANFVRMSAKSNKTAGSNTNRALHVDPPLNMVRDILSLPEKPFPPLIGIAEAPVLRPDGTLLSTLGYDPATQLVYLPAPGLQMPPLPEQPTAEDAHQAREYLHEELLHDFPFASEADEANFLACLLTPIVRPAIRGCVPLGIFDKPGPGSGATLLSDLVAIITTGRPAAKMVAPEGMSPEEEWRKRITAILRDGPPLVVIDNIDEALASSALAAVLTTPTWQDRILGLSQTITLPVRCTWIATGKNVSLRGDLPRRSYRIRLEPEEERPWEREDFKHPDLLDWLQENRGTVLAALLTIVRAWFAADRPQPAKKLPTLGGFSEWVRLVGSGLAYAGVNGFLDNQKDLYNLMDDDSAEWREFLQVWSEVLQERLVTVGELAGLLDVDTAETRLLNVLPESVGWDKEDLDSSKKKLGKALKKHASRIYGGYRLERGETDTHANVARWKVTPVRVSRV